MAGAWGRNRRKPVSDLARAGNQASQCRQRDRRFSLLPPPFTRQAPWTPRNSCRPCRTNSSSCRRVLIFLFNDGHDHRADTQSPELEGLVDARQKLESQQQENQGVQSEFAQLDDESSVYKLVGPVLLKQDKNEAVMAVNGRLEFIEKEMLVLAGILTPDDRANWLLSIQ